MINTVLNYRIIIEPETYEDGSLVYVGTCPTLGISDYGDTIEDLLDSMKDGIQLAIETLQKDGEDVPQDDIQHQIITSTQVPMPSTDTHSPAFAT